MHIKNQIIILSLIMLLCVFLPAIFPGGNIIMISVLISGAAMITLVYQVLKDQTPGFENKDDQMTPP
jgi:heme O synthase-like polyprenyltransferase